MHVIDLEMVRSVEMQVQNIKCRSGVVSDCLLPTSCHLVSRGGVCCERALAVSPIRRQMAGRGEHQRRGSSGR